MAPRTATIAALIQVPGRGTGLRWLSWTGSSPVAGLEDTIHSSTSGFISAVASAESLMPQEARMLSQVPESMRYWMAA